MERVTAVRLATGLIFVLAGAGKFAFNGGEVDSFETFGLPQPRLFVALIGSAEILGGLALLLGRLVRPAALGLATIMVGAIAVSGIGHGDVVPSLTLAPLLLAASAYLSLRPTPR
jgi:putative oxidoreductase